MAPASFWNNITSPSTPTGPSQFFRNSSHRATLHGIPNSRSEDKKSKKAATLDNKKSSFPRNSRFTSSAGFGKQNRKFSDGFVLNRSKLFVMH